MMNDLIEKLSNLRSQFNCFDENERDAYHTLSEAIKVISERTEQCEDAASRQKAIDAVSDGIIREEESLVECVGECNAMIELAVETLKKLPSAQPEPCEDAVSRKEVHNMLENIPIGLNEKWFNWLQKACLRLAELPSVTPKHKTWEWIEYDSDDDKYDVIKCPCCKHTFTVDAYHWTDIGFVKDDFKFCPNCGSKNGDARNE